MIDPNHVLRVGAATDLYVEQLQAKIAELEERRCEICGYAEHHREHTGCLRTQLAAEQLNNKRLRDAHRLSIAGFKSIAAITGGVVSDLAIQSLGNIESLAQPSDASTLDAYVAEKVKELEAELTAAYKSIDDNWTSHQKIVEANRQRDLAVEALKSCGVNDGLRGPTQYFDEDLVERAIKESEAK